MDLRSERLAERFNLPVTIAALLVIPVMAIEELQIGEPWHTAASIANWVIWLVFGAEMVVMLATVRNRWAWVRRHPLEVAIVILTPPFLPASLQSVRAFRLLRLLRLAVSARRIRGFFSIEGLRYASVIALFGVIGGGTAFASVESAQRLTAWDGVYWAIGTVTTAGYGDIAPKTDAGRVIAIGMMLVGVAYMAMLTAALAQTFLSRLVRSEARAVESEAIYSEDVVMARLDQIAEQLSRLEQRIATSSQPWRDKGRPG